MRLFEGMYFADMIAKYGFGYPLKNDELKEFAAFCKSLVEYKMRRLGIPENEEVEEWKASYCEERMKDEYRMIKKHYEDVHRKAIKCEAGTESGDLHELRQKEEYVRDCLRKVEIDAEKSGVVL